MSTEIARFENTKGENLVFTRYCGHVDDQMRLGSAYRERLQISLPSNTESLTCEEVMDLGQKLLEMFPVHEMRDEQLFSGKPIMVRVSSINGEKTVEVSGYQSLEAARLEAYALVNPDEPEDRHIALINTSILDVLKLELSR